MIRALRARKPAIGTVSIEMDGRLEEVEFNEPEYLLHVAHEAGVAIPSSCGGMGTCGACRIEVLDDAGGLAALSEVESEMAEARGFGECERLACQTPVRHGLKIRVPG